MQPFLGPPLGRRASENPVGWGTCERLRDTPRPPSRPTLRWGGQRRLANRIESCHMEAGAGVASLSGVSAGRQHRHTSCIDRSRLSACQRPVTFVLLVAATGRSLAAQAAHPSSLRNRIGAALPFAHAPADLVAKFAPHAPTLHSMRLICQRDQGIRLCDICRGGPWLSNLEVEGGRGPMQGRQKGEGGGGGGGGFWGHGPRFGGGRRIRVAKRVASRKSGSQARGFWPHFHGAPLLDGVSCKRSGPALQMSV